MAGIAAGITVYEPDIDRLKENIAHTLPQVERLYLVDNGSSNTAALKAGFRDDPQVTIIENAENAGIAHALNQMCDAALTDGFDWMLTLDQDSVPEDALIEKYRRHLDFDRVAMLTPWFQDENEPVVIRSDKMPVCEPVHRCNTSASLVKLSVYREVGGFDEAMFIDCVDFDFCSTLEEAGYVILRDNEAILHHRLGVAKEVTFFIPIARVLGIKKMQQPFFTYNHSPLRTYYYARNFKYFVYKHRSSLNRSTERRVYFKWLVLKLVFEKQKWQKLCAIIRGRHDANAMIRKLKAAETQ